MKVALCTPAHSETKALYTQSALEMLAHTNEQRPDTKIIPRVLGGCSRLDYARNLLVKAAQGVEADFILWVDADQTFPSDTLIRLLAHDLPFVGCNVRRRDPEKVESSARHRRIDGTGFFGIDPKAEGLEKVDLLGFGVTLMGASMFDKLPYPWFCMTAAGEDGYFCEQAIKAGYQPHVDHALSMEVGHIAETVLTFPR